MEVKPLLAGPLRAPIVQQSAGMNQNKHHQWHERVISQRRLLTVIHKVSVWWESLNQSSSEKFQVDTVSVCSQQKNANPNKLYRQNINHDKYLICLWLLNA